MAKLLNTMVSVLFRVAMGVGNPSSWHPTEELSKASADALAHYIDTLLVEKVSTKVVPELHYAAFQFTHATLSGRIKPKLGQWVHYRNVDSGVQVSCIYAGFLQAFPQMMKYFVEVPYTVYRIGGPTTVFGKLVDVPICLGTEPVAIARVVYVTFRYDDQPGYYVIFGCTFLKDIHTTLNLRPDQELMYSLADDTKHTIPIVTGDIVRRSCVYQEAYTRIQKYPVPPHSCQSDTSKASLAGQTGSSQDIMNDQVGLDDSSYLCPSLQQIEAQVNMLREFGDDFMDDTWISESSVEEDNWCELPNLSTEPAKMAVHQITIAWAHNTQGTQPVSILISTVAADTKIQYKKHPPKGKPLPKDHMVRCLKITSACHIAIVGLDFVGVTTGLSHLWLYKYHMKFSGSATSQPS